MSDYRFVYKGYSNLSWYELVAITDYMNENNSEVLTSLIHHDNSSPGMRRIIADLASNKLARPRNKKASTFNRDYEIYKQIASLLGEDEDLKLTTSRVKDGAGLIVSERFGVNEGTATKAYNKIKKVVEKSPEFEKTTDIVKFVTMSYLTVIKSLSKD